MPFGCFFEHRRVRCKPQWTIAPSSRREASAITNVFAWTLKLPCASVSRDSDRSTLFDNYDHEILTLVENETYRLHKDRISNNVETVETRSFATNDCSVSVDEFATDVARPSYSFAVESITYRNKKHAWTLVRAYVSSRVFETVFSAKRFKKRMSADIVNRLRTPMRVLDESRIIKLVHKSFNRFAVSNARVVHARRVSLVYKCADDSSKIRCSTSVTRMERENALTLDNCNSEANAFLRVYDERTIAAMFQRLTPLFDTTFLLEDSTDSSSDNDNVDSDDDNKISQRSM